VGPYFRLERSRPGGPKRGHSTYSGRKKYLSIFWFLHNIRVAADVYKRGRAAPGGGGEMLGGTRLRPALDGESWRARRREERDRTIREPREKQQEMRRYFLSPIWRISRLPLWGGRRRPSWDPGGTIMQNKPNFGERAGGPNTQYSTILSFHHSRPVPIVQNEPNFVPPQAAGRRRLCRTKPNLGRLGYMGKAVVVRGVARPGSKTCKTNPIWTGRERVLGAKCAKQSQTWRDWDI
jgi:hypothetical protein